MSGPSWSSRAADDTAEGEAAREYETAWGHPGTRRGIRSGKSAKRRRDAYIRHVSEQQCIDQLDVPIIHQGGQQRPLYTSKIWSPSPSDAEEDNTVDFVEQDQVTLEVCSEEETVQLAQQVQPVWLGPRPRVPKAQGLAPAFERRGVASESRSSSRVISAGESVSVRATSSSSASVRPTSSASRRPPEPVGPPPQRSQQCLKTEDLPGVRVWRVGGDFVPHEIWLEEVAVVQGKLIAFDWHQVTDVCRYSGCRQVQAADNGQVPADVATCYNKVNRRLCPGDLQVIISHIERSEGNLRRVLRGVQQSRLPASYIFITERRAGIGGKTEVAQNLLRSLNLQGRASLCDDNIEVAEEFCQAGGTVFHIKKPSLRGQLPRHCATRPDLCKTAWNVLQHISDLESFISTR